MALAGLVMVIGYVAWNLYQAHQLFGVKDQRIIQILESSDKRHRAELIRRHAFLDLNFIIRLDEETIFTSPDFDPNNTIPFRETILWDKTQSNLIFEVSGYRLFGYNMVTKRRLSDKELLALEVVPPKREVFGLEGQWPRPEEQNH